MKTIPNPFEYEAANNLSEEEILNFYIEDHNFARFIRSTKNIFLVGERGSGKTMTLLFNSFSIQHLRYKKESQPISFERIGIHIPCNTPLFHKKEYLLLEEEYKRFIVCEHFLVLNILFSIARTLSNIPEIESNILKMDNSLLEDIQFAWGTDKVFRKENFMNDVKNFVNREVRATQVKINSFSEDTFYENSYSFSSLLLPFFDFLRSIECLKKSHFLIMIDDAHDMNEYQIQTLNSWIAYRDHSIFSFKVAVARFAELERKTNSGGSILEGHDFLTLEMGKNIYNKNSDYYAFTKEMINVRLQKAGISGFDAETFFPFNQDYLNDLEKAKSLAKKEANRKGINEQEKVTEYIKKYHRAIYFRSRPAKANTPPYSGFEMLVDISTGVVRNILDPCYWMFDKVISSDEFSVDKLTSIKPSIQNEIILQRSEAMWLTLRNGLDKIIPDCSKEEGQHIFQMFDRIMILFKKRLMSDISEPRAIVFTLTGEKECQTEHEYLQKLIAISRKAQILFTRISSGKRIGSKIEYYVPNRILLPDRGLDVKGQYSQVPIKVRDLYESITKDKDLPFFVENKDNGIESIQLELDL